MTKTEQIKLISDQCNIPQATVAKVMDAFMETTMKAVAEGDQVRLIGFGTFEAKNRAARVGRNPRDKSEVQIPATRAPHFRAGAVFKDIVAL